MEFGGKLYCITRPYSDTYPPSQTSFQFENKAELSKYNLWAIKVNNKLVKTLFELLLMLSLDYKKVMFLSSVPIMCYYVL